MILICADIVIVSYAQLKRSAMSIAIAPEVKRRRVGYLVLSTITLLFLGLIYAFSMFAAPMCAAFGYESAAIAQTFNIMMISFCVGAVAESQIEKMLGVKLTTIVSAGLFALGFICTGLFGHASIGVVYGCYGVMGGFGVGVGYNVVIATTNAWFPDRVGFSSGVMLMGFGLGSLVLGTLSVNIIGLAGLTPTFCALGIATAVVSVILALVLKRPDSGVFTVPDAVNDPTKVVQPEQPSDSPLKTPSFYLYWLWASIIGAIGLATIGNCASDAQLVGIDAGFATLLVGLVSTCNGLSRVIVGIVFDRTNVATTMVLDAVAALVATACVLGAFFTGIQALYIVGALCCGFCYGGVPVVNSAYSRQRFGLKNYPLNLSICNFATVYASLINMALLAVVGTGGRQTAFTVLAVLAVLEFVIIALFFRMMKADEKRKAAAATR